MSTHTQIDEVSIGSIDELVIADSIKVVGNSVIDIDLQFGSTSDMRHGDGINDHKRIPMHFNIILNLSLEFQECEYDFDISGIDDDLV